MPEQPAAPTGAGSSAHNISKQGLAIALALVVGGLLAFGAYVYWNYERQRPSAEDAYLMANHLWISPRINGQVTEVHVVDHQHVAAGDLLFRMDPRPFQATLDRAVSAERLVRQDIIMQQSQVQAAEAKVRKAQSDRDEAKAESDRIAELVKRGDEPELKGIQARDVFRATDAALADAKAQQEVARQRLGPAAVQQARVEEAAAAVALARLNLDWTRVEAPAAGWVSRVTLRPGDVVKTADELFVLVEEGTWWVQANYKETKLEAIQAGLPADVRIDSYPDRHFHGRVESIGAASAASFSLLPPQNTTGNWVKVTQRIPVRIRLEPMVPEAPYRLGASARVTVLAADEPSARSQAQRQRADAQPAIAEAVAGGQGQGADEAEAATSASR